MSETSRTEAQTHYLNTLHQAAANMRRATKALATQASNAAGFNGEYTQRPEIYAQNSAQALETIAVLNALMDQGGAMRVSVDDFKAALSPEKVYFSTTREN